MFPGFIDADHAVKPVICGTYQSVRGLVLVLTRLLLDVQPQPSVNGSYFKTEVYGEEEKIYEAVQAGCRPAGPGARIHQDWSGRTPPSEMPYLRKQFFTWAAFDGRGPADEVRAGAKQCDNLAVAFRTGPEAAIHPPAVCAAMVKRGRRGGDPIFPGPMLLCELAASWPGFLTAGQCPAR